MDLNGNASCEQSENPVNIPQPTNGIRVRDMVRRYDTAIKSDSTKSSYSSIVSTKSSYFGVNANTTATATATAITITTATPTATSTATSTATATATATVTATATGNTKPNPPVVENNLIPLCVGPGNAIQDGSCSPTASSASKKTIRNARSPPSIEMPNDVQVAPLETQKSFMNLSRSREPPKAAPREKKPRHSVPVPVTTAVPMPHQNEEHLGASDSSYQSKTTISKTPSGVRIIIDIFFDQNKGLTIEDVVGSRVETDIPPSKILTEFQKRVAESRN